ncbi:MAG TPA: hypothetical protein PKO15_18820 [Fibrobacteria bacterium]|nr:hypothetical protein [Fibrobacteria bacterium]
MLSKIISWFWYNFSSEESATPVRPQPLAGRKPAGAGMFQKMRDMQLRTPPSEMGLTAQAPDQIVIVCMEQGLDNGAYSLRCFVDGTVSLYFTSGGAIIGVGQQDEGRQKGLAFLQAAEAFRPQFQPDTELALPTAGRTRFILVRFDGTFSVEVATADLESGQSPLSPLFHLGHEVITVARKLHESRTASA